MFDGSLGTTNALLGILAAVAVLEALALIAITVVAIRLFQQTRTLLEDVRQQVPALAQRVERLTASVEAVVADVRAVTASTAASAERMQSAVGTAADMATFAASSAQLVFGRQATVLAGVARGLRVAYRILTARSRRPAATTDTPR